MDLIEKIELHREQEGLSKADMARRFGVEPQRYNNWVYRGSLPKSFFSRAEEILGHNDADATGKTTATKARLVVDNTSKVGNLVQIPRLDVSASMGAGLARTMHDDLVEEISVGKEWLRRNVNATAPGNLALITAYGDSMEGTFSDGDLLLVDRGVDDVKVDAVYVLALGDELFIKRLQRRPDGTMLMLSDNSKYPPYEIKNGDLGSFQVLGRVLLAWNARRL
tara:strand:- start:20086 stop:20754 length:669 start_codon:yes stop_codon:yes gene_type:complete